MVNLIYKQFSTALRKRNTIIVTQTQSLGCQGMTNTHYRVDSG